MALSGLTNPVKLHLFAHGRPYLGRYPCRIGAVGPGVQLVQACIGTPGLPPRRVTGEKNAIAEQHITEEDAHRDGEDHYD